MIRAVIFDVGGVLAYDVWEHLLLDEPDPANPDKPVGIASFYGLRRRDVERVGRKLWKIYSRPSNILGGENLDLEDHYWCDFIEELKDQLPRSIRTSDLKGRTDSFIQPVNKAGMESLLKELQSKKLRLVICSDNTEFWFRRQVAKLELHRFFSRQDCFVSYEVGYSKDSPRFEKFHAISQALEMDSASCVFIDDRQKNVEWALKYGFTPMLFPSHSSWGIDYLRALFSQMRL
ncbi:MAG: HAD family hydrolase [Candidatus Angelobacter sp.]